MSQDRYQIRQLLDAFCVFDFMATFEPTGNALMFRIGYTVIGVGCLVGMAVLIGSVFRNSRDCCLP